MLNKSDSSDLWLELDKSKWQPVPALGSKWIGKWTCSNKGYMVIISDGVEFWGEHRNALYIKEKAEEWAACLESGIKELAELVLNELEERNAELKSIPEVNHNKLTIELSALLDQFPFNWLFYLSKLPNEIIERHWAVPITTSLEYMSERIFMLEEELKRKNRQLEELLPPQTSIRKDTELKVINCLETAAQNVVSKGLGVVICSHLGLSSPISEAIDKRKEEQAKRTSSLKSSSVPHNRPRPKIKKPIAKGAFGEGSPSIGQPSTDLSETERRAEIQALTQGTSFIPTKKKKKLNI